MSNKYNTTYIGDISNINANSYSSSENWEYVNYLDTGNITKNKIDEIQYIDLSVDKLPSRAKRKVIPNSIIYSTVRPNQQHFGFIDKHPENFLVSTGFAVIDINPDIANPKFVYYYLTQDKITEGLHALAEQSVSAYPSIKPLDIGNVKIVLPDLPTQEKIAGVLSSLDDKIELNNKINQNLEQQAQAIFKSWFVDFEPFGGKMPKDWRIGALGEYIKIKRGGSPRPIQNFITDKGYKWLKISDVTSLQTPFIYDIKESIKESGLNKTVLLKAGTLVLSNSATPGIPKILGIDSCIHDGWLYFPEAKFSNEYLYLFFKSIRKNLVSLGNGSVFTNLKTDILRNYQTVLPSESVLKNFDSIVKPIFSNIQNNTLENTNLTQLRDTLLPKLMSGEINVDDVEV